jgi:P pilus assembly chaperone PapD
MRTFLARLATVFFLAIPTGQTWAQIGSSRDSITIDASRERSIELVVWNTGATELEASVRLQDRQSNAPGASPTAAPSNGCGNTVSVSPSSIRLGPGEQRTLRIVLDPTAPFHRECSSTAVVQPFRIASRPLSTERTIPRSATIPLHVTSSEPLPGASPSHRAW